MRIWNNLVNMHIGKKIYAMLWLVALIFLICFIVFVSIYGMSIDSDIKYADRQNVVAGLGLAFAVMLTVSIFTTASVSIYLKKIGAKK